MRFSVINGTLLIAAGLMVFAFVVRIPFKEVWATSDVKGMLTAALGIVVGVILVRTGFMVRRRGRAAPGGGSKAEKKPRK